MTTKMLGTLGFIGVGYFVVAVVALHFLDTDLDPVRQFISEYSLGDYGWLMKSAFFVAGLGTFALTLGLRRSVEPGKRVRTTTILMTLAGVGFFFAGGFDSDPTPEKGEEAVFTLIGNIHFVGSLLLFIGVIAGAFFFRGVFARNARWNGLSRTARWYGVAMVVTLIGSFTIPEGGPVGVPQRIFVPVMISWLLVLGWYMRNLDATD